MPFAVNAALCSVVHTCVICKGSSGQGELETESVERNVGMLARSRYQQFTKQDQKRFLDWLSHVLQSVGKVVEVRVTVYGRTLSFRASKYVEPPWQNLLICFVERGAERKRRKKKRLLVCRSFLVDLSGGNYCSRLIRAVNKSDTRYLQRNTRRTFPRQSVSVWVA